MNIFNLIFSKKYLNFMFLLRQSLRNHNNVIVDKHTSIAKISVIPLNKTLSYTNNDNKVGFAHLKLIISTNTYFTGNCLGVVKVGDDFAIHYQQVWWNYDDPCSVIYNGYLPTKSLEFAVVNSVNYRRWSDHHCTNLQTSKIRVKDL